MRDGDWVQYSDVVHALNIVSTVVHRTPFLYSKTFSRWSGCEVYLKLENLQRTGAFKIRGAYNMIAHLSPEERQKGVVCASAGNHAQGVALSASLFGIPATVVMPEQAPQAKIEATEGYGAKVLLRGNTYNDAYEYAMQFCRLTGATFVHAFDHPHVIAGQGTVALEMLQDRLDLDAILVPIGGGGLIAGVGVAVKAVQPQIQVIGIEPAGSPSMLLSLQNGRRTTLSSIQTIADGLAVKTPGELTFSIVQKVVDDVITVTEEEISEAMWLLLERNKSLVEGAGAVGVAALLSGRYPWLKGKKVAVIVSGGNVDMNRLLALPRKEQNTSFSREARKPKKLLAHASSR